MNFNIQRGTFCKILETDGYQMLVQKEYDNEKDEDVVTITQSCSFGSMTKTLSGFPSEEVRDTAFDKIDETFLQNEIDKIIT